MGGRIYQCLETEPISNTQTQFTAQIWQTVFSNAAQYKSGLMSHVARARLSNTASFTKGIYVQIARFLSHLSGILVLLIPSFYY